MLVGYARVSTQEQDLALQLDALKTAGCSRVFEEKASGAQRERPALKAALEYMREGDTLVVSEFDRLGRSLEQAHRDRRGLAHVTSACVRSPRRSTPPTPHGSCVFQRSSEPWPSSSAAYEPSSAPCAPAGRRACRRTWWPEPASRPRISPLPRLCCSIPNHIILQVTTPWVSEPRPSTAVSHDTTSPGRFPKQQPCRIRQLLPDRLAAGSSHSVRFIAEQGALPGQKSAAS